MFVIKGENDTMFFARCQYYSVWAPRCVEATKEERRAEKVRSTSLCVHTEIRSTKAASSTLEKEKVRCVPR